MGLLDRLTGGGKPKTFADTVDRLPERGPTVLALKTLDFAVPDQWDNCTDFDALVAKVTGDDDPEYNGQVRARALELYEDKSLGYQKAHDLFKMVDDTDKVVALAVAVEKFDILNFLDRLTPKPEKSQAIDLTLKVIVELVAFTKMRGLPGDGVDDFVKALGDYAGDSQIRMAAMLAFDGVVPLGPNCIEKAGEIMSSASSGELAENKLFRRISRLIPGSDDAGKLGFIQGGFERVGGWMNGFITDRGLEQGVILDKLGKIIDIADDKVDYVGAVLDATTNYMEHTGTQTVATHLIERASAEV